MAEKLTYSQVRSKISFQAKHYSLSTIKTTNKKKNLSGQDFVKRKRSVGVSTQCNKFLCGIGAALVQLVCKNTLNSQVELYRHFQLYSATKGTLMRLVMSINILPKVKLQNRSLLA